MVGLREININKFVDKLNNFSPLLMIFRHIVSDCDATINDQVEMNTLSSILTLYLSADILIGKGYCCKTKRENI